MTIPTADTLITTRTMADAGVRALFAGTLLAPYTELVIRLSHDYGIDAGWIMAYLFCEHWFCTHPDNISCMACQNPFDIVCSDTNDPPLGAVDCWEAPNGYAYAMFGDIRLGFEAGFKLWRIYVRDGYSTWETASRRAAGDGTYFVPCVLERGRIYAEAWPYVGPPPPPPPIYLGVNATMAAFIAGATLAVVGIGVAYRDLHARSAGPLAR